MSLEEIASAFTFVHDVGSSNATQSVAPFFLKNTDTPASSVKFLPPVKQELSEFWVQDIVQVNGVDVVRTRSKPEYSSGDQKRTPLIHFPGFKITAANCDTPEVQDLIRQGVPITIYQAPDPGDQVGYLQHYNDFIKAVLFKIDRQHEDPDRHQPYVLFHSIMAQRGVELCMDDNFLQDFDKKYSGAAFLATHFGSTLTTNWYANKLYHNIIAPLLAKKVCASTFIEQYLLKKAGSTIDPNETVPIVHRQASISMLYGEYLMARLQKFGFPERIKDMNFIHILGTNDNISAERHIRMVAKLMGAEVLSFDAEHDLFAHYVEILLALRDKIKIARKLWNDRRDGIITLPARPPPITASSVIDDDKIDGRYMFALGLF